MLPSIGMLQDLSQNFLFKACYLCENQRMHTRGASMLRKHVDRNKTSPSLRSFNRVESGIPRAVVWLSQLTLPNSCEERNETAKRMTPCCRDQGKAFWPSLLWRLPKGACMLQRNLSYWRENKVTLQWFLLPMMMLKPHNGTCFWREIGLNLNDACFDGIINIGHTWVHHPLFTAFENSFTSFFFFFDEV